MNFSEFVSQKDQQLNEMARVLRAPVPMDQEDIKYLNQFPYRFWRQALYMRYGQLLTKALDDMGNLHKGWQDVQTLTLPDMAGFATFSNIDTGISGVVNKLKNMGFDLHDPDPGTKTGMYNRFMNLDNSTKQLTGWIRASGERFGPEKTYNARRGSRDKMSGPGRDINFKASNPILKPGYARWTPNRQERSENSYEAGDIKGEIKWRRMEPAVRQEAAHVLDKVFSQVGKPENPYHVNYYYWSKPDKKQELLELGVKRVHLNLKDPHIDEKARRHYILRNVFMSAMQTGHLSRRRIEAAREAGIDPVELLKSGMNPEQMTDYIANYSKIKASRKAATPIGRGVLKGNEPGYAGELPDHGRMNTIGRIRNKASVANLATGRPTDDIYSIQKKARKNRSLFLSPNTIMPQSRNPGTYRVA